MDYNDILGKLNPMEDAEVYFEQLPPELLSEMDNVYRSEHQNQRDGEYCTILVIYYCNLLMPSVNRFISLANWLGVHC